MNYKQGDNQQQYQNPNEMNSECVTPLNQIERSAKETMKSSNGMSQVPQNLAPSSAQSQTRKMPMKIKVIKNADGTAGSIIGKLNNGQKRIFNYGAAQRGDGSVFSPGSQAESKVSLNVGGLQRVSSIRKQNNGIGIMGGLGQLGNAAAQLGGGIASRTTSRGGGNTINNPSPQGSAFCNHQFYKGSIENTSINETIPGHCFSSNSKQQAEPVHYKKLKVNSEVQKPPIHNKRNEQSEKEKNHANYQLLMQNFANNNYLSNINSRKEKSPPMREQDSLGAQPLQGLGINISKIPVKSIQMPQLSQQEEIQEPNSPLQQTHRPGTPEEQKKKCLNCSNMEDFIKGLQGEIKRLQDLTNDLQLQLILGGVQPQLPQTNPDNKPFENICPQCAHTKALQRPASSRAKANEFKIRKQHQPAALAVVKQKRNIFEQEQQEFIQDMKHQLTFINNKGLNPATAAFPSQGAIKLNNLKKKRLVDLSPINQEDKPQGFHSKKSSLRIGNESRTNQQYDPNIY